MAIQVPETKAEAEAILRALQAAEPAGSDWDADIAADARRLTEEAGWSWDFTTWGEALADFEAALSRAPQSAR